MYSKLVSTHSVNILYMHTADTIQGPVTFPDSTYTSNSKNHAARAEHCRGKKRGVMQQLVALAGPV